MELRTDGLEFLLGAAGTSKFQHARLPAGGCLLFQAILSQISLLPVPSPGAPIKPQYPVDLGCWGLRTCL